MTDMMDRLDQSLQSGRHGRPTDPEVGAWLATLAILDPLKNVPQRSAASAEAGLAAFLSEARGLPVSEPPPARHHGWKVFPFRKEHPTMNVLASLALVVSLVFGGAGATAFAAQSSQPDEALYGVKLATEDLRLGLITDPQERLALALNLVQVRTQEMIWLVELNRVVPEQLGMRLQSHVETALQSAADLGDAPLAAALTLINERSQTQLRTVTRLREQAPEDRGLEGAEAALARLQSMAQLGQDDPGQFRQQARSGQAAPTPSAPTASATSVVEESTVVAPPTATPLPLNPGYGPGTGDCHDGAITCTPEQDGNSYGPGPGNPSVTPGTGPTATLPAGNGDGAGFGPGDSSGNGQGGQPDVTPNPTAGNGGGGYGPGPLNTPAPEASCTPELDGNGPGPGTGETPATPAQEHQGDGGPQATPQPGNGRP